MNKTSLRAVFLGTPAAAVPSLESLAGVAEVVAVLTRPDRPSGRGKKPRPSPVKVAALSQGISVIEVARASDLVADQFAVDVAVVAAFGVIIPPNVLQIPRQGFINVHFSLLPRWRGAAPVAAAIAAGDPETGVSIMVVEEGLDTGPVLAAQPVVIGDEETAGQLTERLSRLGAALLAETIPALDRLTPVPQVDSLATYAPRLTAEDRILDLAQGPEDNARRARAMSPKPGAYLVVDGQPVGIVSARPTNRPLATGRFQSEGDQLLVGSDGRGLELVVVRPPGRREMAGSAWARGWRSPPAPGGRD